MRKKNVAQMESHKAVLACLRKHGPMNYLDVERELGMAGARHVLRYMQKLGLAESIPKARNELIKFNLTADGLKLINELRPDEAMKATGRTVREFVPLVVKEPPVRPGSMRAYELPSLGTVGRK